MATAPRLVTEPEPPTEPRADALDQGRESAGPEEAVAAPGQLEHEKIAALAYRYWEERCPDGCPEEDWFRAEQNLIRK